MNRIKKKDYQTGTDVIYTYDEATSTNSKGRLTTVTDASGMTKFFYDKLGRIVKTTKTVEGFNYTFETTYDALGRTASIKYPDNETISYVYDAAGNLSQVTGYVTYSNYNALGQAANITYANGVSTAYQYHPLNNRLFSITTNSPTSGGLQNISYAYDSAGNITALTDDLNANRTQNFTYDHLNRLTQAQSAAYGTLTYTYNQIGNMTYNSQVGTYTYSTNGIRPHAVLQAGPYPYTYDQNGNMITRNGNTITYDYENRPVNMGSTTFVYDYSGQRVKKNSTVYIGKLYECAGGSCIKYVFAGGNRIATKSSSAIYFYHADHLGSTSIATDASGAKVEETYYYPFGGTRTNWGISLKHKFTGQEEDPETGLYYYGARYYDPQIGRFISADSIVQNPFNPQALNRYTYVLNNPLKYTDPNGQFAWIAFLIGAAIGALTSGAESDWDFDAMWRGALIGGVSAYVGATVGYGVGVALGPGSSVIAGAAGGAAAGATSAALSGGNIAQGAIIGFFAGLIGGGIGCATVNIGDVYVQGLVQISTSAAIGGLASEAVGGTFWKGFEIGAISAAAAFAANYVIEASAKTESENQAKIEADMSVNYGNEETYSEWQMKNSVQVAEGMTDSGGIIPKSNASFIYEWMQGSGFGQLATEWMEELANTPVGQWIAQRLSTVYQRPTLSDIGRALENIGNNAIRNANRGYPRAEYRRGWIVPATQEGL